MKKITTFVFVLFFLLNRGGQGAKFCSPLLLLHNDQINPGQQPGVGRQLPDNARQLLEDRAQLFPDYFTWIVGFSAWLVDKDDDEELEQNDDSHIARILYDTLYFYGQLILGLSRLFYMNCWIFSLMIPSEPANWWIKMMRNWNKMMTHIHV